MEYYDVRELILVVQGDNLFKFDLVDLIQKHKEKKALMSIALVEVENVEEYGVAELGKNMLIKKFIEKPSPEEAPSNLVSAGIYLISPEIRTVFESEEIKKLMKDKNRLDFGYDLIPYLIGRGYPVYGYHIDICYDIGTPERYLQAMLDVLHGRLDIRILEKTLFPNQNIWVQGFSQDSIMRRNTIIKKIREDKLHIKGAALIGRHMRIGDYSEILESCIDNFCILDDHVYIEKSAIMDGCKIGSYSRITESIIGRKTTIDSSQDHPTYIEKNSVIGNNAQIREGSKLIGTRVNPNLIIPRGMTYINKFLRTHDDVVQLSSH
jgi:NDP-sugar pyrophosphorylase family protein